MAEPKKIIIDTDPGIDDAMAIFLALESPEVEVIGLTTIYGNVPTSVATRNSLHLVNSILLLLSQCCNCYLCVSAAIISHSIWI
uniref:Inosine/uridine-preferring nucleoside hydrolase domain-containing protein n=1 Tax=Kalanchoe fedtschenkoi TaxID=63787 RepID=A0A7N0VI70_KALFE